MHNNISIKFGLIIGFIISLLITWGISFPSSFADNKCSVTSTSLIKAIKKYSNECNSFTRKDCDPIGNGNWTCSSEQIGLYAPVANSSECSVTSTSLVRAIKQYSIKCSSVKRTDCDPVGNGKWKCSSEKIGSYAPNQSNLTGTKTTTKSTIKNTSKSTTGSSSGIDTSTKVCSVLALGLQDARNKLEKTCDDTSNITCISISNTFWKCSASQSSKATKSTTKNTTTNKTNKTNGLIIFEAEDTSSDLGEWKISTGISGYSGDGHLIFHGNNESNGPANSPLKYTFTATKTGEYRLMMRIQRRAYPGRSDVSNDGFVRLEGNFSSGNGAPSLQQLKINTKYYGGNTSWSWNPSTPLDIGHKKYKATYNLKSGEKYTLVLSGRSKYWSVDKIVFAHSSISDSDAKSAKVYTTTSSSAKTTTTTNSNEQNTGLYVKGDLVSLHYDFCPDPDDGHAVVSGKAVVDYYGLNYHVVMGTCGYNIKSRYDEKGYTVINSTHPSNYEDAMKQKSSAIANTAKKWLEHLNNGNTVHVAEGGQSDFTADVVKYIKNKSSSINTKKIKIYQHSGGTKIAYNEVNTITSNLNYLKNNTTYILVPNGNIGGNGSADLAYIHSPSFIKIAKASYLGAQWKIAFNYLNPSCKIQIYKCKLDFSDTVELLKITGDNSLKDVNSFAEKFLIEDPTTTNTVTTITSTTNSDTCSVSNITELKKCFKSPSNTTINIKSDISCNGSDCCDNGKTLINLSGVKNLTVKGNGKAILRSSNQRNCKLINISGGENIVFNNLILDDDENDSGCVLSDKCPRMIDISGTKNITFQNISIENGKGYVMYVKNVNGFTFDKSSFINAGILGMYIGHGSTASTNITITNSYFANNSTNALAILGLTGTNTSTNIVENNTFEGNHHIGQWAVAAKYGEGFTGGGQVYIAQASNLTFKDNIIRNGKCSNCYKSTSLGTGISGLELGLPNKNSVSNMLIQGNTITNNDAYGIYLNHGVTIGKDIIIKNNTITNSAQKLNTTGASMINN